MPDISLLAERHRKWPSGRVDLATAKASRASKSHDRQGGGLLVIPMARLAAPATCPHDRMV